MSGKLRPFPSSDSLTARLKRSNQSMERNSASGRAQATAVILHDITVMADKLAKQAFDKSYGQSPRSTDFLGRNVFAFSLSNTVQLRIDGINELPLSLSHLKRLTPLFRRQLGLQGSGTHAGSHSVVGSITSGSGYWGSGGGKWWWNWIRPW